MELQMYKYFFKQKKKNLFLSINPLKNSYLNTKKFFFKHFFINNSKKNCTFANSILTKKE
jgi:hypothetical protein